jgi:hypothetical protein
MATPLFLKSETFGSFNFTYVPAGGICPPGQVATPTECLAGPCPDLCLAGEPMTLSGEPEVQAQPVQPAEAGSPPWLSIAIIAISLLPFLAARRRAH